VSVPAAPPPRPRVWTFGVRAIVVLLVLLLALDAWAMSSVDPDFYLPDVFRPLGVALTLVFVASGFVRATAIRRGVRLLSAVIVVAILLLEVQGRYAPVGQHRIERTDDVLLRYRYRPGTSVSSGTSPRTTMEINHLGLWDREYAIPKPADVYRIVILTGSIANDGAIPYDERFHEVLERRLVAAAPDGMRVEVINASCEGYDTLQQVRLLERVAMEYEPDFVVVAYMLTSASLQDGSYRRIGNSFFAFRFLPAIGAIESGSRCSIFAPFHEAYSFDLIVRSSLERLAMLRDVHHFETLVAVLPILEEFDDPLCNDLYARVARTARESGHDAIEVVDAFRGDDFHDYEKPDERMDLCHPNALGHARIAEALEPPLLEAMARHAARASEERVDEGRERRDGADDPEHGGEEEQHADEGDEATEPVSP
jgi:lysophospholipase L1-like esterase